jgi:HEAT repeat protein
MGAVFALKKALKAKTWSVRYGAALALATIRPKAELIVPALTTALSDANANVREGAAIALGEYGTKAKSAVPALLGSLRAKMINLHISVGKALLRIDPNSARHVVSVLRQDLKNTAAREKVTELIGLIEGGRDDSSQPRSGRTV